MARPPNGQTAIIYEFPLSARMPVALRSKDLRLTPTEDFSDAAFGGSWYHEAAIRDEDTPTKSS